MSFGSVFQSVGTVSEKERSLSGSVLTDGMCSIRMSAEDQSCLEGVKILSRSERQTGPVDVIAPKQREQSLYLILASIGSQCRVRR